MDNVGTIFAVRLAGVVVDDAEFLYTLDNELEVDFVVVALAALRFERTVVVVFNACHEIAALDRVFALGECQEVGFGESFE